MPANRKGDRIEEDSDFLNALLREDHPNELSEALRDCHSRVDLFGAEDRDGNDRWTTEIIADEMQMLGGRGGGGSAPMSSGSSTSSAPPQPPADEFDDDIPF